MNEPVKLKLLKDRPYEGKSDFGLYLLYSVEENGVEKAYFAPPEVHQEILKLGCKGGDEIRLTKIAEENGKRGVSKVVVERLTVPVQHCEQPARDNLGGIMEQALREAVDITRAVSGVPFQNEDIQKIASCLFIARTRGHRHAEFSSE